MCDTSQQFSKQRTPQAVENGLMGDSLEHTPNSGEHSAQRRAAGAFFTPPAVVRYIVHRTLGPLLDARPGNRPLRILEPSCGQGVFLAEAFCYLRDWERKTRIQAAATRESVVPSGPVSAATGEWPLTVGEQHQLLLSSCFGLDIDPKFVAAAREQLGNLVSGGGAAEGRALQRGLRANVRCGDALLGPDFPQSSAAESRSQSVDWQRNFAGLGGDRQGGFDAIIGNPPYVNIRRLTTSRGAAVKRYLRTHYQCARGAFDLYVLFLELAFRVLRPGGLCGLIVPNKLAGLTYAAPCRSLLVEQTTIDRIVDLSQWRVFPEAGVYPYVLIWKKQEPASGHRITVVQASSETDLESEQIRRDVPQASLAAAVGWQLHGALDVESRVATRPLGTQARLHSGTTGFLAAAVAAALTSEPANPADGADNGCFRFIVSGNIDRYLVRWGQARFMQRSFVRPVLPSGWQNLTAGKRQLYQGSKIVIAGMTRRIEAAWDPGGLALGVQVFAATDLHEDRRYLLGLLNSKLFSFLFRTRFRAQQLSGGYWSINKGQLDQLPIRMIEPADRAAVLLRQQLVRCAESLERVTHQVARAASSTALLARVRKLEQQIDECVYRLYQLTADEVARIEADVPGSP